MKNKDKKLEKLKKEIEEIEAKLGNRKLADSELKTLFAHADKKKAEIEALERKRGKAMETPEYSLLLEENYLEALRKIYQERIKGKETGSFRKPKHLVNASTNIRPLTIEKASLFSSLDETQIAKAKTPPMMGIDLTRGERKLVNCFSMILHQRSQTIDDKSLNYYSGDTDKPRRVKYVNNDIIAPLPELRLTLYELTKVYSRKDNPSGRDMKIVNTLLEGLLHKTYYVELDPIEYRDRNNQKQKVSWRGRIALFMLGDTDNGELLIQLNSIFALQIRDFYVNYPINYDELLEEANLKLSKSRVIPNGVYIFIEYLASRRGVNNSYKHEIYKSTLYEKINYKWAKRSKIKELNENIERGINIAKEIGLLEKYEEITGSTGEIKYIFHTRKDWIKR